MNPRSFPFFHMVSCCEYVDVFPVRGGGVEIVGRDMDDGYPLICIVDQDGTVTEPYGMSLADVLAAINNPPQEEC